MLTYPVLDYQKHINEICANIEKEKEVNRREFEF